MALLLGLVWLLVFTELILPLNLNRGLLLSTFSFFLFTYGLQIHRFAKFRKGTENPRGVLITFFFLGLFIHLFCAALTKRAFLFIPALALWEPHISALFIILAVVFNVKGVHTGLKGPKIKKVFVKIPSEYKNLEGTRIVQVSDLHVGPVIQNNYVQPIANEIKNLNPDLVVFTGDIGDGDSKFYADELRSFCEINPTYGKYYVTGNHEHMWGAQDWIQSVERFGIQPLINKGHQVNSDLFLGGVPDISSHHFAFDSSNPHQAIQDAKGFKVLLAHQPKSCIEAEKAGFDLMLSGHTHNGQFFPFNFFVGLFNPYTKGLNQHGSMQVYVNAGTGFWGPPLRLGVDSEVTLLILTTENEPS